MEQLKARRKGFTQIIMGVVGAVLATILIVSVALPVVFGANQTTWDATTKSVYTIVPVLAVIGLALLFINIFV